ncbi:MAG TPA: 3-hydroxyacyl-CoA dehydrogenase NAD-binding domain-containing protein [Actinomycetes bacterium]|nr:3-hydroxyacyl-CoA dehydrogenase NAD-binding domain-containing protein [Actinomycetes bacterium]
MAREFTKVGVVGLGTMGAGIAEVFARNGIAVVGIEQSADWLEHGRDNLRRSTDRAVGRGKLTKEAQHEILGRILLTTDTNALADVDLVVEAVPERLELKQEVFGALDEVCRPEAVLATNTSSLPVTRIGIGSRHPGRVLGMHFFNPATVLKLVEVVSTDHTDAGLADDIAAFASRLGKVPVVVGDRAGFVANALLFGYLNQAIKLAESGSAGYDEIDAAMTKGAGLPMGPFALLDLIGLDTAQEILRTMHADTGDDRHDPAASLRALVEAGRLGRKTAQGFFGYEKPGSGRRTDQAADQADGEATQEIVETLLYPHLVDAMRMRDSGYATATDIDNAMKFGCGYPKGPFELIEEIGADRVKAEP